MDDSLDEATDQIMNLFRPFRFVQCSRAVLHHFSTAFAALFTAVFLIGLATPRLSAQSSISLTSGLSFATSPGRASLDPALSLAGRSFTVEAWIWLNASGGDRPVLAQMGTENLLHLLVRNDRLHLGFWVDDLTGGSIVPTGGCAGIAGTF